VEDPYKCYENNNDWWWPLPPNGNKSILILDHYQNKALHSLYNSSLMLWHSLWRLIYTYLSNY
jgi:hypothetical protein